MDDEKMTLREYLLAWVFASINAEHGFALSVTKKAYDRFGDNFMLKLQKEVRIKQLKQEIILKILNLILTFARL